MAKALTAREIGGLPSPCLVAQLHDHAQASTVGLKSVLPAGAGGEIQRSSPWLNTRLPQPARLGLPCAASSAARRDIVAVNERDGVESGSCAVHARAL